MAEDSLERWRRASELFDQVRDLDPAARAIFLAEACGPDREMARLVEELVEAEGGTGELSSGGPLRAPHSLLRAMAHEVAAGPPPGPGEGPTLPDTTLHAADEIGPYHLLEKVGEGGMGEVWRAEQTRPIRRAVALKVIKAGLDTKRVVARFEAERQVLALMDHPAIAKVYQAGETPRGLPYFAMEYVAGEPVTDYCDRHRLGTKERLDLFARICEGVQHAHEKGVIHRDLKPSNVLVTLQGDRPVPKIIDFGVAKATAQRLTERTLFTERGVMIGTPSYMSPEQAEMTGLDVDTRTDVYALGVMLYELLTGVLPFDAKTLREAGYDEIRRRIREVDPPKPSTRAGKLGEDSAEIAQRRGTDPAKLASRLRGDLDWIVMRCLEKDRVRRYASPNELAADLRRHLTHEPVAAGPPGAVYRARKFVRRHRIGVAVSSAAVVALAGFAVTTSAQNRRIAAERDRADQEAQVSRRVTDFMTGLFAVSDPSEARGNTITAREILDRGAERIENELKDEPGVKARLLLSMGRVYGGLGLLATASSKMQEAVDLYARALGSEHRRTLGARLALAINLDREGRYPEAEGLLRETLEAARRTLGEDDELAQDVMNRLAVIFERQGRNEEAAPIYRRYLEEVKRRATSPDDNRLLWATQNVGWNLVELGKPEEGEPMLREAADGLRRVLGDDHPQTMQVENNLAQALQLLGRLEEAEALYRGLVEAKTRVLGRDHPSTNAQIGMLAAVLGEEGRVEESEALFLEALEALRQGLGVEHPSTLLNLMNLGLSYARWGRFDDATRLISEAHDVALRSQGPTGSYAGAAAYGLACVSALCGRPDEALRWLRESAKGCFGGWTSEQVLEDEDLKSLRDNPEFERILAATRAPSDSAGSSREPGE